MTLAQAAQKAIELGGKLRRPRAAGEHQRVHQDVGDGAGRPGADGRRARHLSARRRDAFLRRRLRGSRSRRRDRQVPHPRLPGGGRRRHGDPSARARRPGARPLDARHRARDRPEVGLRPALRRAAREAVLPEQAADDSRRAAEDGVGGAGHPRSGNAGRRARHRRAAGRRRLLRRAERAGRRASATTSSGARR